MADASRPLNIKDPDTARIARELARLRGTKITRAVRDAVQAQLDEERRRRGMTIDRAAIKRIQARIAASPVLDGRTPDEILGYDTDGLPG